MNEKEIKTKLERQKVLWDKITGGDDYSQTAEYLGELLNLESELTLMERG